MPIPEHTVPVAIVGGGPIGLELAAGLRHVGIRATIFDSGSIGSTLEWWAPNTTFFSSSERIELAGVSLLSEDQSKATRERYLAYLRGIVTQFDLDVRTYCRVVHASHRPDGFELLTVGGTHGFGDPASPRASSPVPAATTRWRASTLVLAIGNMHRPRLLNVVGEHLPHVSHYFDDPHRSFRRRVLIVGGRNSAVEAAIRLHRVGAEVTISYRHATFDATRVKYWLLPELEWLIREGRVGFHPNTVVREITPEMVFLGSADGADSTSTSVPTDQVYLLTGYEQDPELFTQLGVPIVGDDRAPQHDPETMETAIPGLFVAGTAAAGSQRRTKVFIETSHVHVERIVRRLTGRTLPWAPTSAVAAGYANLEES